MLTTEQIEQFLEAVSQIAERIREFAERIFSLFDARFRKKYGIGVIPYLHLLLAGLYGKRRRLARIYILLRYSSSPPYPLSENQRGGVKTA